ncbi:hypothetical protein E4U42_005681, partial [Claviceps africana]
AFHDVYERALRQRFYVLRRSRRGTDECPEETCEVAGSTGNVYTVEIGRTLRCTCPHALKDNHCKHIIYILARVLHAPYHHVYQRALLSSELRDMFASAPGVEAGSAARGSRRRSIEGDCPICFCPLDVRGESESVVWCRAACGQNMHRECFAMWARTGTGGVTCPFCRSVWLGDPEVVDRGRVVITAATPNGFATDAETTETTTHTHEHEHEHEHEHDGRRCSGVHSAGGNHVRRRDRMRFTLSLPGDRHVFFGGRGLCWR